MKKEMMTITIVILICLNIISIFTPLPSSDLIESINIPENSLIVKDSIIQSTESIHIEGNIDFINQATLNSWPGDGSQGNPYIIADKSITVYNDTSSGISISNTDIYFEIKNMILENGYYDRYNLNPLISLKNVRNGKISNNVVGGDIMIHGSSEGDINLQDSNYNTISNNTVLHPVEIPWFWDPIGLIRYSSGIKLNNSNNNLLSENNASIILFESVENSIVNNVVYELELENSGNNTIIGNNIAVSKVSDIFYWRVQFSSWNLDIPGHLKITGNSINDCLQKEISNNTRDNKPILVWQSVTGGTIPGNDSQIYGQTILINCSSVEIKDQYFNASQTGKMDFRFCQNLLIKNCTGEKNLTGWGGEVLSDPFWWILHQKISALDSYKPDITFSKSTNNIIMNSTILTLLLESSMNNTILNNLGVNVLFALNSTKNTLINNTVNYVGGYDDSSFNNIINNIIEEGITVESNNTKIINNTFNGPINIKCHDSIVTDNTAQSISIAKYYTMNTINRNTLTERGILFVGVFWHNDEMNPPSDYFQEEVLNNTINDKEIVFWQNINSQTLPNNTGQVILINCSFIEGTNLNLTFSDSYGYACHSLSIHDSVFTNSSFHLVLTTNNILANNSIINGGFQFFNSNDTTLVNNSVYNGRFHLRFCYDAFLINNSASNFQEVPPSWKQSRFSEVKGGFVFYHSTRIKIEGNKAYNNLGVGFRLLHCDSSTIEKCQSINNSGDGFRLDWSSTIKLSMSSAIGNGGFGILISSDDCEIFLNNFITNCGGNSQAFDEGLRNHFASNYWSDHDNSINEVYLISGGVNNRDHSPADIPFDYHHLLVPPRIIFPTGREILPSDEIITISWTPAFDSKDHSVIYSVYYSPDAAATWELISDNVIETEFKWNVSNLPSGSDYLIKIVGKCSEGLVMFDISNEPFTIFLRTENTTSSSTNPITASSIIFVLVNMVLIYEIRKKFKLSGDK